MADRHKPSLPHVARNFDPALDVAHEHHHAHLHHDATAEKGRQDDIVYSTGTTSEPSVIPDQDPLDHALHRRHHPERKDIDMEKDNAVDYDAEKGGISPISTSDQERDPQSHKFARFYARYRIFFHLFIALLFTGYALLQPDNMSLRVLTMHPADGGLLV